LLSKRPELEDLTERNIIKDKAQHAQELRDIKQKQSRIENTLARRPSVLQMKQKGVLYSHPGADSAKIAIKKRQFAFRERQNSLNVKLHSRLDPSQVLQISKELELDTIAEHTANTEFQLPNAPNSRRSSFFDGVGGRGVDTRTHALVATGQTSISELVRIDHVMAEHKRQQELDQGSGGGVYMWGQGSKELGLGDVKIALRPQLLQNLMKEVVTMVACGKGHTMALTKGGDAFAWGANQWGQLGLGDTQNRTQPFSTKFRASPLYHEQMLYVAAGEKTSAAITVSGELYVWGYAKDGALGCGSVKRDIEPLPCKVESLNGQVMKQVSLGSRHSAAITEQGVLYSWGVGLSGALGHPEQKNYNQPKILEKYTEFFAFVDCGKDFTAAIGFDGSVYTWGDNSHGQLGHSGANCAIPTPVMSLWRKQIVTVKCGQKHCVAMTDEGGAYSTLVLGDTKHQAKFQRLTPGRVLCSVTTGWDDTAIGMTPDGRQVIWDIKTGVLIHEQLLLAGKTITGLDAGETFSAAIGTWHPNDDLHQNPQTAHLPIPSSTQRLKKKHTHRARQASLVLPQTITEDLAERLSELAALQEATEQEEITNPESPAQ
jgi:hypothetical protein